VPCLDKNCRKPVRQTAEQAQRGKDPRTGVELLNGRKSRARTKSKRGFLENTSGGKGRKYQAGVVEKPWVRTKNLGSQKRKGNMEKQYFENVQAIVKGWEKL